MNSSITYKPNITFAPTREEINQKAQSTMGVYIFRTKDSYVYIGKSVSLKARLLSHLEAGKLDRKEAAIFENATQIDCIITDSEFKALILESELIRTFKPHYNVRWKDDKSYLYIKVSGEELPHVSLVRRENDGKSRYFGPFGSTHEAESVLRGIRRIVPFCTLKRLSAHVCFYSKIGQCNPCPNLVYRLRKKLEDKKITQEKEKFILRKEISTLKREYRANIRLVCKILSGETEVVTRELRKQMKTLGVENRFEEAIVARNRLRRLEWLSTSGTLRLSELEAFNQSEKAVVELLTILTPFFPNLTKLSRIECYDNSTLGFTNNTASMVVFEDGLVNKKEYRRFKLSEKAESDFEMMDEVLRRRLDNESWTKPDLIVLDGGKPQLMVAQKIWLDVDPGIPYIGIAKNPDRLLVGVSGLPTVKPLRNNLGFRLVQTMRDEAHRFAKTYQSFLRDKSANLPAR